jgi:hypothetical protein
MTNAVDADKPINWLPDANPSKSSLIRGITEWCSREIGTPLATIEGLDRLEYDSLLLLALGMGYEPNEHMRGYLAKYRNKIAAMVPPPTPAPVAFDPPSTLDREMDLMEASTFPVRVPG